MKPAYYNEIDKFAAQWLRNLIQAGHIAPGEVDERSITDVKADDLAGYGQCHFFAGIGIWSLALRNAGWPDDESIWTGSCPCQPFSAAGKGAGFSDERHLWPHFARLIGERRPAKVLGEQVASKDAEPWLDLVQTDLEAMGYAFGCVPFPSAGIGAPHIRDRNYWVANSNSERFREARNGVIQTGCTERLERDSIDCGMADSNQQQRNGSRDAGTGGWRESSDDFPANRLVAGFQQLESRWPSVDQSDNLGRLANPSNGQCDGQSIIRGIECDGQDARRSQGGSELESFGEYGRLAHAHAHDQGLEGRSRAEQSAIERIVGASGLDCGPSASGPVNGFWRDSDWLFCRDGKWRPVEPGTFPLAHGAPGRVGRLRAYGNAINAIQAQIFIEAVMECRP